MRTILLSLCAVSLFAAGELSNRRAPGFALPDSKGKVHDLQDLRGKIVIIEFMQSQCPHCSEFADTLERVNRKYAGRIAVLIVANPPDNANTISEYIKSHKITSPVVFDCGQAAYSFMRTPSFDIPHVFVIDGNGMIRNDFGHGPQNAAVFSGQGLDAEIDKLLAGTSAPAAVKPVRK
jgi:peroxiredoxin